MNGEMFTRADGICEGGGPHTAVEIDGDSIQLRYCYHTAHRFKISL